MNILVFSWRDPKHPMAGGAEQVMHEHMKGWVAGGHVVTLFSSRFLGSLEKESLDGINIVREGNQYLGVQIKGCLYYLKNNGKYDLVIDQFHGIPFFTPLYVSKPKLAVIQESAGEVWWTNPLTPPLNWLVGFIGYFGEPFLFWVIYRNTNFMTGSESAKKDLMKFGIQGKNIKVIPHGVILDLSKPLPPKNKVTTITYLGVISKDKGILDGIRCFADLNKKGNYLFWVIGKSESENFEREVKKLVKDSKLEKKITFWGFVPNQKKFELLAKTHILINPSIREGWGLVNIEANSVGVPVVAYNSLGLVDSVKNGVSGLICTENSPNEMSETVFKLLANKSLYEKLTKGAVQWSKNFDWKRSQDLSLTLIRSIV